VRLSWAQLLKRVFELDLEHCPNCGGEMKIIAAILERPVIEKILTHLGLQARRRGHLRVARRCKRPEHSQLIAAGAARCSGLRGPAAFGAFWDRSKRPAAQDSPVGDPP